MKEKELNYKFLIIIAVLVPIILGITYAYFLANVNGTNRSVTGNTTAKFDIDLVTTNDGYINATDLLPITADSASTDAAIGTFSVKTGNNDYKIKYTLYLDDIIISDNLKNSEHLKWELVNKDSNAIIASGNFLNVASKLELKNNMTIDSNQTNNYEIRVYILETNTNQIELLAGTLKGKISMEADMIDTPSETVTQ